MAIQVQVYNPKVGPARIRNIPPPALQKSTLPIANNAEERGRQATTAQVGKAAGQLMDKAAKDYQTKLATDVLDEYNDYHDKTRVWEANYRAVNKGKDAATYDADLAAFHKEEREARGQRFVNDKQQQLLWNRKASQLENGSMARGTAYMEQQDAAYRKSTSDGLISIYKQKVAELGDATGAINALRANLNTEWQALNPGVDPTATFAKIDLDTATTRIRAALARDDVDQAVKLTNEYEGILGDSYDEITAQTQSAWVKKKAWDYSEDIRKTHPNANLGEKNEELDRLMAQDNIDDKRVAKQARSDINQTHNNYANAQAAVKKEKVDGVVTDRIESEGDPVAMRALYDRIALEPDGATRAAMYAAADAKIQHKNISDEGVIGEMNEAILNGASKNELIIQFQGRTSKPDFDQMMTLFQSEETDRKAQYLDGFRKIQLPKIFKEDWKLKQVEDVMTLEMTNWINAETRRNNMRVPTKEEMDKHANYLFEDVIYNENWYGDDKIQRGLVRTLTPDQYDTPKSERGRIYKKLQEAGEDLTEENINLYYQLELEKSLR